MMAFNGSIGNHGSVTDPDARLYRKGKTKEAKLCYQGHTLMENRSGLIVRTKVTTASGSGEREAAKAMVQQLPGPPAGSHLVATKATTRSHSSGNYADSMLRRM